MERADASRSAKRRALSAHRPQSAHYADAPCAWRRRGGEDRNKQCRAADRKRAGGAERRARHPSAPHAMARGASGVGGCTRSARACRRRAPSAPSADVGAVHRVSQARGGADHGSLPSARRLLAAFIRGGRRRGAWCLGGRNGGRRARAAPCVGIRRRTRIRSRLSLVAHSRSCRVGLQFRCLATCQGLYVRARRDVHDMVFGSVVLLGLIYAFSLHLCPHARLLYERLRGAQRGRALSG
jgi:hypothetical protein